MADNLFADAQPPRVLFLGGFGRSGSTIVGQLLGEYPGVCNVGEVTHLWRRGVQEAQLCGCGDPFPDCGFWQKVGLAAFGGWEAIDAPRVMALRSQVDRMRHIPALARRALAPPLDRAVTEYVSYYLRVYQAIAGVSGCGVVVDSSKNGSLAFCLRWAAGLDLRVVHLVRDSRAVAYSWARQVARPDVASPTARGDASMWVYSPAAAAMQWNAQNGAMHLLARRAVPVTRVRYEDFAAGPAAALARIAGFAGLPSVAPDAFLTSTGDGPRAMVSVSHTVSGNPARFSSGPIAIRPDQRWQAEMPAAPRRAVTALTFPLLLRYGYAGPQR